MAEEFVPFRLPAGLELGCATAAAQIEGGRTDSSWYHWASKKGRIKDGSSPERANRHWKLYEQDIRLMARMGIRQCRMSVEWSRIEPERGRFDEEAVGHYRAEIKRLLQCNIHPLVTLHHFSNPMWFERMGAFEKASCVPVFLEYVTYTVERLKDLCTDFVTINEPNVYATEGYLYGTWPPGKRRNIVSALRVMRHMALCHLAAYREIHRVCPEAKVGFANHLRVFTGFGRNPVYALEAKIVRYFFQDALTESMSTGKLAFPLGCSAPYGKGKFCDYIGINYYSRSSVKHFRSFPTPGFPTNDLGWEIYPEGIALLCREQYEKYGAPIWVTENGTCDGKDRFRAKFLYDHIRQIAASGLPVERYYHWTFLDNFEWVEGESAPFGLVECDFATQKRTVRPSGEFYAEMCRTRQVTRGMIARYLRRAGGVPPQSSPAVLPCGENKPLPAGESKKTPAGRSPRL